MPPEEKTEHMLVWWHENLKVFAGMKLKKVDYFNLVMESRILLRHGIEQLMHNSAQLGIPFYIVSGGISEIIEASIGNIIHNGEVESAYAALCWQNAEIFSNSFC